MKLFIKNLRFPAIIGIHDWEKERLRQFRMDVTIDYDASKSVEKDDFTHALDYGKIESRLLALAGERHWNLIETLADSAAECLLREFPEIEEVSVAVEKPQAMHFAESVTALTQKSRNR